MRLVLLLAVLLVGYDAIVNDGAYTKATWAKIEAWFDRATAKA